MYNSDKPNRADLPSKRKLIRSTIIAAVTAAALLVTVILPAEYGIDPTRIGGVLGLTDMGEIKQQLASEANQQSALGIVETVETANIEPEIVVIAWSDETTVTLEPGAAAEVKLTMIKGGFADYEWVTNQGHLNSDLHADGDNKAFISYRQGKAETSDTGSFKAEFDGVHGWYWRNRSDVTVDVTLRVKGEYTEINRVM